MNIGTQSLPLIDSIKTIGSEYAAWLVDVWGVMHNGVQAFPKAVEATRRFREQGGLVVLLSNSPRPQEALRHQLERVGVPDAAYDATVSSGDLTRHELAKHKGARVFHLGPERDLPTFQGLDISRVGPDEAELVVCTGLFEDETETPDDYRNLLRELAEKRLTMLCANPDHLVERGDRLVYCAGALAAIYANYGGAVIYAGKPHAPVYELALETLSNLAHRNIGREEVLAIGDGVHTDIEGAAHVGLDAVFVMSGLHAPDPGEYDEAELDDRHFAKLFHGIKYPRAAMRALAW